MAIALKSLNTRRMFQDKDKITALHIKALWIKILRQTVNLIIYNSRIQETVYTSKSVSRFYLNLYNIKRHRIYCEAFFIIIFFIVILNIYQISFLSNSKFLKKLTEFLADKSNLSSETSSTKSLHIFISAPTCPPFLTKGSITAYPS